MGHAVVLADHMVTELCAGDVHVAPGLEGRLPAVGAALGAEVRGTVRGGTDSY
jgi:hypothetical protein